MIQSLADAGISKKEKNPLRLGLSRRSFQMKKSRQKMPTLDL